MKKPDARLLHLCGAARDETFTNDELAELEARLASDAEARRFYLEFIQLHSYLESFPPIPGEDQLEKAASSSLVAFPAKKIGNWLAAAAAMVIAGLLAFQMQREKPEGPVIATLVLAENCDWASARGNFQEGQPLSPGRLKLDSGTAIIRFVGGAELVLSDATEIELLSAMEARLRSGEVVVRAEEGAEGFTLETPARRLVDLGTEFAVKVEDSGATELHVHEGKVAVGEKTREEIIDAGHAIRMERGKDRKVDLNAPRFAEMVKRANPKARPDLMRHYEGFNVDAGVYQSNDMNGGKGWDGPWRFRTGDEITGKIREENEVEMKIAHGQMNMAWPLRGGERGMLEMPPGPNVRIRTMAEPIDLSQWGIHYFSFLVTESPEERGKRAKKRREDIRLTFRSSDDYFGEALSFGWEWNRRPRVSGAQHGTFRSLREVPAGQTVLCVGKIITRETGQDEVLFRFYSEDDTLDLTEPAEWDIATSAFDLHSRLDLLLLTSDSHSARFFDEIRIGPSWRSVTPIDPDKLDD